MKKIIWISIAGLVVIAGFIVISLIRKQALVIAVVGDYSAGDTAFATYGYQGVLLAAEEINDSQNDLEYVIVKIDMDEYDTVDKISQQLDDINADVIIGPFLSGNLTILTDFLLESDRPVFVPSATHDSITGHDDLVFRLMNATSIQGHQTAEALADLEYEKIYAMYDSNNQMYTKEFIDYFSEDENMTSIAVTEYELSDSTVDFTTMITSDYEAILICAEGTKTAETINNLRDSSIDIPIFMCSYSDSSSLLSNINHDVERVYLYTNRNIQFEAAYNLFVTRYMDTYTTQPSIPSMYSYEIMYMLHNTIYGKDITLQEMNTYINQLDEYQGLFFKYYQEDSGDFYTIMGFYEVDNNTFIKINSTQID